jgi:hypothetical protein
VSERAEMLSINQYGNQTVIKLFYQGISLMERKSEPEQSGAEEEHIYIVHNKFRRTFLCKMDGR